MAATMKALRKMQATKGLQMDTVAVPLIGPTDVLVRVKTASICGTDLHIYGWDRWSQGRIKPPVTLRHGGARGRRSARGYGGGFCKRGNARQLRALPSVPAGAGAHLPEPADHWD